MAEREKVVEELELTAQPKSVPDELAQRPLQDSGLSIDPEDLGRQFLSEATEQQNFESQRGGDAADMWVNSASASDEALPGPNYEGERSVWENTVSMSMENGGPEGAQSKVSPAVPDEDEDEREDDVLDAASDDVDLTETNIQEASLLDHEGDELGEIESPSVQTDDTHTHGKRRGGHARPHGRRHAAH